MLGAGALAGAGWAAIAAALRVYRSVPEVISTIMLNFVALYLVSWAVTGPLKEPGQDIPRTVLIPAAARLPALGSRGVHQFHASFDAFHPLVRRSSCTGTN